MKKRLNQCRRAQTDKTATGDNKHAISEKGLCQGDKVITHYFFVGS